MGARNRKKYVTQDNGEAYSYSYGVSHYYTGTSYKERHVCDDTVDGTHNDHGLSIEHRVWADVKRLNGTYDPPPHQVVRRYSNSIPQLYLTTGAINHAPLPAAPSISVLSTRALAKTNPSRATLSLPVFIGELKDLPGLIKVAGRKLLQKGASGFLAWQFGWKPLISDLRKMLDIQAATARKRNELDRLYGNGGLKRRIVLQTDMTTVTTNNVAIESRLSDVFFAKRTTSTMRRIWATVRWLPTATPSFLKDDASLNGYARNLVLGLESYRNPTLHSWDTYDLDALSDAWELMPWSWLSDWFGTVGDYAAAYRNTVPAKATGLNIMTQIESVVAFSRTSGPSWAEGGDAHAAMSTKLRSVGTAPVLTADISSFNILTGRQLAILGAIFAQRAR